MTIHEHIRETLGICDAVTPGEWGLERGNVGAAHPLFLVIGDRDGVRLGTDEDTAFAAHARTVLPRYAKALEVAVMGIDGEIGAASCCGRTTQYARLHKLRAEIQAALEGR